jgi:hypothetical protein
LLISHYAVFFLIEVALVCDHFGADGRFPSKPTEVLAKKPYCDGYFLAALLVSLTEELIRPLYPNGTATTEWEAHIPA